MLYQVSIVLYEVSIQALFRKYIWMIIIKNYKKNYLKKLLNMKNEHYLQVFFLKVLKIIIITVLELF